VISAGAGTPAKPKIKGSDMEYQLRNWYDDRWLSGDHIVAQPVPTLETRNSAMGDQPPITFWSHGERTTTPNSFSSAN